MTRYEAKLNWQDVHRAYSLLSKRWKATRRPRNAETGIHSKHMCLS
jgi:hypothetical protein